MSSRFVSAGHIEPPSDKEDAWKKAQEDIETSKKRQEEAAASGGLQDGGQTLFEVLQANKAKKQEAFEESLRLKNQVQFLNEEDEEYLASLSKNERAQRAVAAKEAREQLAAFRRQQEDAEKKATDVGTSGLGEEEETWSIGAKKRKKSGKEQDLIRGVKLRKTSSAEEATAPSTTIDSERFVGSNSEDKGATAKTLSQISEATAGSKGKTTTPALGLGLGAYSSDEED